MEIYLDRLITLATDYCGYKGKTKELIVNWVNMLFLKAQDEASKEDNPTWNQSINCPFVDEYWKAACTELETIEGMLAWEDFDQEYDINAIRITWYFKLK